jgi:hypothetical protein
MTPGAAKSADWLFNWNGTEALVNFSRVLTVSAAETYLIDLASRTDAASNRYLAELNITRKDIKAWQNGTLKLSESEDLRQAIRSFTDQSILRPNSTQRTTWGNDKRWGMIWQLKSFFYSFGKVVVGGAYQEIKSSVNEGRYANAALQPIMMSLTFMPLAALGLWARGLIQYDMWEDEGENFDPYEDMYGWRYRAELAKRSGFYGPFEMALGFAQYDDSIDGALSLMGPAIDHMHALTQFDQGTINRSIPLWSQLYGAQKRFDLK